MTDYKWTLKRIDGVYVLTGFIQSVEGDWLKDGASICVTLNDAFEHIRKQESDRKLNLNLLREG